MSSVFGRIFGIALLVAASACTANALGLPTTEDFVTDTAKWKNTSSADLVWNASGGPDGGSYVSSNVVFQGQSASMGLTLFRGHDDFDASGDAFVGNWLATGIGRLSAYVRQNTGQPLSFFARVATKNNFPAVTIQLPTIVPSNTWTRLDFDLNPASPYVISEGGPGTYQAVMGAVGNVQISVGGVAGFANNPTTYKFDLDKVSIGVPEPASVTLLSIATVGGWMLWRHRTH